MGPRSGLFGIMGGMRINHVIRVLITSDFLVNAGFSVFAPVFAIFVTGQISDGSAEVVGFAAAITQVVKVSLQIPVARWLDKNHGEYDDFWSMSLGSFIAASTPFLYLFADRAAHLYLIQAWLGIGLALAVPPWYAIFTRHIDKLKENVEWSMESVAIGISGAGAAALSGIIVHRAGFEFAFVLGGLIAMLGAAVSTKIYKDLRAHVTRRGVKVVPDKAT